jgi:ATP-binding protein involved in chromosome partitioning
MSVSVEDIRKALSTVEEPDLKQDLITLNMVKDIAVDGNEVKFTVILTTPACPLKELIRERCVTAIHRDVDASLNVTVDMDAQVTSTRNQAPVLPGVKNIIAIASGKGGVGKSTVSCNLAFALAETGARVGLIDADIYGPSVPTMFGVENARPGVAKINGKETLIPIEQFGVKLLSMGLLVQPDDAIVWRGPMATQASDNSSEIPTGENWTIF